MSFELARFLNTPAERQEVNELLTLERFTIPYGLALTEAEAKSLTHVRQQALTHTGRLEFGGSILPKLILAFRTSPHLHPQNFASTLAELTEIFYTYKNETMDALTDDELISAMKSAFDGPCHGSTELLAGRDLEELARAIRSAPLMDEMEEGADEWN